MCRQEASSGRNVGRAELRRVAPLALRLLGSCLMAVSSTLAYGQEAVTGAPARSPNPSVVFFPAGLPSGRHSLVPAQYPRNKRTLQARPLASSLLPDDVSNMRRFLVVKRQHLLKRSPSVADEVEAASNVVSGQHVHERARGFTWVKGIAITGPQALACADMGRRPQDRAG